MKIPLATDLISREGATSKDAKLLNCFIEPDGQESMVIKRPASQGGILIGNGVSQGGIGLLINGTPFFIGFWADTMQTYTGGGTSWNSGTSYLTGAHVTVDFEDYWALDDNIGNNPITSSAHWSTTYYPSIPRYTQTGSTNTVSTGESTEVAGGIVTTTRIYTTKDSLNNVIDSGTGSLVTPVLVAIGSQYVYSNYITPNSEASANATSLPNNFIYTAGYSYYKANGTITYVGGVNPWSGQIIYSPY